MIAPTVDLFSPSSLAISP